MKAVKASTEESAADRKILADLTADPYADGQAGEADEDEALIEDYLDHIYAPLVGMIPWRERRRLRDETAYHLERAASTRIHQGHSAADAARLAIQEYGDSAAVSDEMIQLWMERSVNTSLTRKMGRSVVVALACFSLAHTAVTLLEQAHISMIQLQSNPAPMTFGLSPAQIRRIIPLPLPLPESSPTFLLLISALIVLPLVAGFLTGWLAPIRSVRSTYHVQVGLTMCSFLAGFLMLPACYGLLTAVFQCAYWLPMGCLTAHFGAVARRCHEFQFMANPLDGDRRTEVRNG